MACRIIRSVCKTEGENKLWGFDYAGYDAESGSWGFLVRTWQPGLVYPVGIAIRPSVPTGYQYIVATGNSGQSGSIEPRWPKTIGATVTDGSVTWECEEISNDSLTATILSSAWEEDLGVTTSGEELDNSYGVQRVGVKVAGGVAGRAYEVKNAVTLSDGRIEEGILRVSVE